MTDPTREIVADIFDRGATLALARVGDYPPDIGAGLAVGAALAKIVATLVRTLGVEDTKALVDELVARRNDGAISDEHVACDDDTIANAVASMYKRGTPIAAPIADESFDDVTPPQDNDAGGKA